MFKPLSAYIGLRYTRSKKRNHFVSFISLSSMLGIALGVMVLITVLSVMNGFDTEIHKRFFGMAPEITVSSHEGKINNWQAVESELETEKGVVAVAPFVGGQGLLTNEGQVLPIVLTGIDPAKEEGVSHLSKKLIIGSLDNLPHFGILLGRGLADSLGVMVGDMVTIMIPQATVTPAGMIPRFKRFRVAGVFSAGTGFNFDTKLAFINLKDAQTLFQLNQAVTGLKMKIKNIYEAPALSDKLSLQLGEEYEVGNWTQQFGPFFHAVKLEKTMMFLMLLLIIAVASFNLVSSLVMVVNDKQSEIAILRTIGAPPSIILWIFIVQGMMVGVIGTFIGLVAGIALASNVTAIVNFLQKLFNTQILSANMYFVDYLPSKILMSDLWHICLVALLMSFLATIYPAWRASKTVIAEALHYE
ncbi:MAG: lipoprotein-releasing ABC transporter permease subunit [Proteobacteria bacterium]|nr:lipoprotein-releasing ABC transporter permease subunit [Pseudomonadota bacterium]